MKNKFFYFFIATLCFVGFTSCGDEKEDTSIQFYTSSERVNLVSVTSVGECYVEVRNAVGIYTVKSNNEAIATAELNEYSIIRLKGVKEGTTTITLIDSENRSATLNVEVVIQTESMLINKHETLVEALNPTTEDQVAIDRIKSEIISKLPPVGGGFKLIYTSDYAGNLIYYPDTKKLTEKIEGTFKWHGDEVSGRRVLKLSYNDAEFVYSFGVGADLIVRSSQPPLVYLIIDFTDIYSQMITPKITKAIGGLLITNGKGF